MPDAAARHGPVPPDDRSQDCHDDPSASRTRGPSPAPAAAQDDDPLAELVARLRGVGLDPDVEQLCDALWLARWTRPVDVPDREEPPAAVGGRSASRRGGGRGGAPDTGTREEQPERAEPAPQEVGPGGRVSLYPVPQDGGRRSRGAGRAAALPVGVPAAPALPAPLE
ncbi:SAV_2336 N-terminal domain-related protein, partial [Streptomyces sp. NPDC002491]